MTGSFRGFLQFPERDRRDVFAAAAARLDTVATHVEKDFWVCLVLDLLFGGLPEKHPALLFKGGTSLSKAFGLIDRLSEDIDLVVDRESLGFTGDRDPIAATDISGKKRKSLLKDLRQCCSSYMAGELRNMVTQTVSAMAEGCSIRMDPEDTTRQTLLIGYPTVYPTPQFAYVSPTVKVEGGARSATKPSVTCAVAPLIAREFDDALQTEEIAVIAAERAYWEKLLILHGWYCGFRDDKARLPTGRHRVARHYYDVATLTASWVGESALARRDILNSVRNHNLLVFPQAWKRFEEAVPGTLRFVPDGELRGAIERDYRAMESLVFGDAPEFGWVMDQLRAAEEGANRL